jgi:hypothetical protein
MNRRLTFGATKSMLLSGSHGFSLYGLVTYKDTRTSLSNLHNSRYTTQP